MSETTPFADRLADWVTRLGSQPMESLKAAGMVSDETLIELALQPTTPVSIRLDACWLLPRIAPERAEGPLVTALRDEDPHVRAGAAMSLCLLSNDSIVDALLTCLEAERDL